MNNWNWYPAGMDLDVQGTVQQQDWTNVPNQQGHGFSQAQANNVYNVNGPIFNQMMPMINHDFDQMRAPVPYQHNQMLQYGQEFQPRTYQARQYALQNASAWRPPPFPIANYQYTAQAPYVHEHEGHNTNVQLVQPEYDQPINHQATAQGQGVLQEPKEIIEISDDEEEEEEEVEVIETTPASSQDTPASPPKALKSAVNMGWYKTKASDALTASLWGSKDSVGRMTPKEKKENAEWQRKKLQKEIEERGEPAPEKPAPQKKAKRAAKKPSERAMKRKRDEDAFGQRDSKNAEKKRKSKHGSEDVVWAPTLTVGQIQAARPLMASEAKSPASPPVASALATPPPVAAAAVVVETTTVPAVVAEPITPPEAGAQSAPAQVIRPANSPVVPAASPSPVPAPSPVQQEETEEPAVVLETTNDGFDDLFDFSDEEEDAAAGPVEERVDLETDLLNIMRQASEEEEGEKREEEDEEEEEEEEEGKKQIAENGLVEEVVGLEEEPQNIRMAASEEEEPASNGLAQEKAGLEEELLDIMMATRDEEEEDEGEDSEAEWAQEDAVVQSSEMVYEDEESEISEEE